jgi:ATP-dependent helicase/nuclease subunit B
MNLARTAFAELEAAGERRDIWLRRFALAARKFLAYERAREPEVRQRHAEIEGQWEFPNGLKLTGRADRIDELKDGRLAILDFKTGAVPAAKDMRAFLAPQLPLEAVMAQLGGFGGIPPGEPAELGFIKIGLGPAAFVPMPFQPDPELGLAGTLEEVWTRMQRQAAAFLLSDDLPMPPYILPDTERRYPGDYDHLARVDEWSLAGDEEP